MVVGVKPGPRRTCLGCRKKASPTEMIRVVFTEKTGKLVIDQHRKLGGRGAWAHPTEECLRSGIVPARLQAALKLPVRMDSSTLIKALDLATEAAK